MAIRCYLFPAIIVAQWFVVLSILLVVIHHLSLQNRIFQGFIGEKWLYPLITFFVIKIDPNIQSNKCNGFTGHMVGAILKTTIL